MPASVRDVLLLIRTKEDAQRALSGISREMRRAAATADAAQARAMAASARAQAEQMRATGATQRQIDAVVRAARAWDQQARNIETARRRTEHMRFTMIHAGDAAVAMGASTMVGGAAVLYGLKQAVDTAVEYERQVRHTATQVDGFKGNLQELGDIGRRVAQQVAIPFEQIQPALFDIFGSMEIGIKESEALLRSFSKAAVAGQVDIQSVARATIGIMNAFKIPTSDVNKILDIQFQLIQEGIGTYEEWSAKIGNVTPSAVRAGQSIETMMAALATATRLGLNASRATTAVSRAFDVLSNPKSVAALKRLGVSVTDAAGNFRPFNEVMEDFRKKLQNLPEKGQLAQIEAILSVFKGAGSTIEARKFLQGILLSAGGLEIFNDLLKETSNASGSLDSAYGLMADSVSAQSDLLRNKWMLLKEALGTALIPEFVRLIEWLQKGLDWFNNLPSGVKDTIASFLLWAGIIGIAGGALLAIIGTIVIFATAIAGVTASVWLAVLGVGAIIGAIGLLVGAIIAAYKNSQNFRDLLGEIGGFFQDLWQIVVNFATGLWEKFQTNLLPALKEFRDVILNEVVPAVQEFVAWLRENFLPKAEEAARIIKDVLGQAMKFIGDLISNVVVPAISDLIDWWNKHKDSVLPFLQILFQVGKWLAIIAAVIVGVVIVAIVALWAGTVFLVTNGIKLLLTAIGWIVERWKDLIKWIGNVIDWFKDLGNTISGWVTTARNAIGEARDAIVNAFSRAGEMLRDAGRNIINGLIGGIQDRLAPLRNIMGNVAGSIRDFLPFSPAKRGPLSGAGNPANSGRSIVKLLSGGILSNLPWAKAAANKLAEQFQFQNDPRNNFTPAFGTATPAPVVPGRPPSPGFDDMNPGGGRPPITVNVYTHEIDPRKNAAELGWELEGRL